MPKAKYQPEQDMKYIDQTEMAKLIATQLSMPLSIVMAVIELEQKMTMLHVRDGYKVTKKNYIIFTPIRKPGYTMRSKITGKAYAIPERLTIRTRLGQGFKSIVSDGSHKMPNKICRFVDQTKKASDETLA